MSLSTETGMILHNSPAIRTNASHVRDAFPFGVQKLELFGPNGERTGLYGLFRDDTWEQIADSSVSAKYTPHSTDDVAAMTEAALCVFGEDAILKTHWHNGHVVTIEPSKADRLNIFGTVDNIFPTFSLTAGYNGKGYCAGLVYKRDMCRNMACMRTVSGSIVSIRHTKNMYSRMRELQDVFGGLSDRWTKVGETALRLEESQVNLASFLDAMYPQTDIASKAGETRHKARTADIVRRIVRESIDAGRNVSGFSSPEVIVTGWQALQGLQGYLQHETLASERQKTALGKIMQTLEGTTATLLNNAERYLVG